MKTVAINYDYYNNGRNHSFFVNKKSNPIIYTFVAMTDSDEFINEKENEDFLLEFLLQKNQFPLYIYFEAYREHQDILEELTNVGLVHDVKELTCIEETYWIGGENQLSYHPPLIKVIVKDKAQLKLAFEVTYTFATSPLFYAISFCESLEFKGQNDTAAPYFDFTKPSSHILIGPEGLSWKLITTEDIHSVYKKLINYLPPDREIVQINDEEI